MFIPLLTVTTFMVFHVYLAKKQKNKKIQGTPIAH